MEPQRTDDESGIDVGIWLAHEDAATFRDKARSHFSLRTHELWLSPEGSGSVVVLCERQFEAYRQRIIDFWQGMQNGPLPSDARLAQARRVS